jgi:hypothetical protein
MEQSVSGKLKGILMKKNILFKVFLCIALILLTGCLSKKNASEDDKTIKSNESVDMTTGSFIKISNDSDPAKEAFDFLKSELKAKFQAIVLGRIISAESQVVAGQKLRLLCNYKDEQKNGKEKLLRAEIYIDLSGKKILDELQLNINP